MEANLTILDKLLATDFRTAGAVSLPRRLSIDKISSFILSLTLENAIGARAAADPRAVYQSLFASLFNNGQKCFRIRVSFNFFKISSADAKPCIKKFIWIIVSKSS